MLICSFIPYRHLWSHKGQDILGIRVLSSKLVLSITSALGENVH